MRLNLQLAFTATRQSDKVLLQRVPLRWCRLQLCRWHFPSTACKRSALLISTHPTASAVGPIRSLMDDSSGPRPTIDDADWAAIGQQMREQDEARETLIKRTRDAQKLAKQAIFSLHRGDNAQAGKQLEQAEAIVKELLPLVKQQPALRFGSYAAALEEYAEGVAFKVYLEEGRLVTRGEMRLVELEEYLGGVLDMTGELNRYAIAQATKRNTPAVAACRDLVEGLMGQFLQLDFKNGGLRKKFDGLKYTLKKLENTMYELSLAEAHMKRFSEDEAGGGREDGPQDDPDMHD